MREVTDVNKIKMFEKIFNSSLENHVVFEFLNKDSQWQLNDRVLLQAYRSKDEFLELMHKGHQAGYTNWRDKLGEVIQF